VRWRAALGCAAALVSAATAETIELRGGEPPVTASSVEFRPEGLVVETAGGRRTLAWDLVRDVRGRELTAGERERLALAERLWRGRSRLVRGDAELARSAFEAVAGEYLASPLPPTESGLIAAEGLLRTRLASGDVRGSIVPSLEVARLRASGVRTDRFGSLPPVLDEATGLAPGLAAAFALDRSDTAAVEAARLVADAIASWASARPDLEPRLRELARGWESALRGQPPAAITPEIPAARLVQAAARLAAADAGASDPELLAAREEFESAVAAMPAPTAGWVAAWRAYLLGRSLARGRDPGVRREGVVLLLSIPARRTAETELLSRIALAESILALRGIGDAGSAARLERELLSGLPTSPPPSAPSIPSS
jgi:hypothetical protein